MHASVCPTGDNLTVIMKARNSMWTENLLMKL